MFDQINGGWIMFTAAIYHQDIHNENVKWQSQKQISPQSETGKFILHSMLHCLLPSLPGINVSLEYMKRP